MVVNRNGFSLIELVIVMGITGLGILMISSVMESNEKTNRALNDRATILEVRTMANLSLYASKECSAIIRPKSGDSFSSLNEMVSKGREKNGYPIKIINVLSDGEEKGGLKFHVALKSTEELFTTPIQFGGMTGRSLATNLEIKAVTEHKHVTRIRKIVDYPLNLVMDESGNIISCKVSSSETTSVLKGKKHRVRDCLKYNGYPIFIGDGQICRFNGSTCPVNWKQFESWSGNGSTFTNSSKGGVTSVGCI